jgi:branched-chain amino acid transport system ATP-binding protein
MNALAAQGLVAGYSTSDMILKGVDFRMEESEIVGVFGPNGAGKSTLLKVIAGLLKPREGRILVGDVDLAGRLPTEIARSGIVFVPQESNVFNSMTVEENLEIGAFLHRGDRRKLITGMLRRFPELERLRRLRARSLSGGQKQVLAMAMALAINPKIVLLDEPSAGLSPIATERLLETIRLVNRQGVAVALVEQNVRAALKIVRRAYILVDGRNVLEGFSEELASNPEIRRKFLGQ